MSSKNLPDHMTLPAKYYTDPEYFLAERQRFFGERWFCAGRADQIPKPGDYFLREIAGESLIVVRDDSGKIQCHYNVCRHRGTRLCESERGNFTGRIQCPYHAWTWSLDGRLVGAPHMDKVERFCNEDFPLHRAGCEVWDGNIFVHFSASPPPLRDQLGPEVMELFRPWRMEDLRLARRIVYEVKANWKLLVQNYSECLHCPVIHPALKKLSSYLSGDNEAPNRRFLGGHMTLNEGVETLSVSGKSPWGALPSLSAELKRRAYFYWLSPNLLLSPHPDYLLTHTLWPKAVNLTEVICEWHFHPSAMQKPGFSPEEAVKFWDEVNREDWHVSELSQLGISSRAYQPGPYSHRETLLHGLDQIITGQI